MGLINYAHRNQKYTCLCIQILAQVKFNERLFDFHLTGRVATGVGHKGVFNFNLRVKTCPVIEFMTKEKHEPVQVDHFKVF